MSPPITSHTQNIYFLLKPVTLMNNIINASLLIDDDRATTFFNRYLLLKHGAFKNVKTLQGGMEALDYLKNLDQKLNIKPDLIFLDINMPFMSGWDFLREFARLGNEIKENIKIIMLSTSSDPRDLERAGENKYVNDFINKPLTQFDINRMLQKHFSYRIAT